MHSIRFMIVGLVCMIGTSIYSSHVIEYDPEALTRLIESGQTLSRAMTDFTNTVNETSPNILKIIGAGKKTAETLLAQTDTSLLRHFDNLERLADKYSLRGITVLTGAYGFHLAYLASQSFIAYKSAPETRHNLEKNQHLHESIMKGFFSALSLGIATYLYLYHWDAHLAKFTPLARLNSVIPSLS